MIAEQARKILKQYDRRLVKQTTNCIGSAAIVKNGRWKLLIFLKERKESHDHLLKMRFGEFPRLSKDDQTLPDELEPELVIGKIKALYTRTTKWRPAPGGISIGHYLITAGTFGAVVYKGGERFILSNNHILANSNDAEIGDPIYQPGPYDGGGPADEIGTLEDFVPVLFGNPDEPYNYIDAAICRPNENTDILDQILELTGLTSDAVPAKELVAVTKSGRTTGRTDGYILGFSGVFAVDYEVGIAWFDDQIVTEDSMGAGGDSGSLLYNSCGKAAVGLLFAGGGGYIFYGRATRIVDALGVTFTPVKRLPVFKDWMANEWVDDHDYLINDVVYGTDLVPYQCKTPHHSVDGVDGNRPVIGKDWKTCWTLAPVKIAVKHWKEAPWGTDRYYFENTLISIAGGGIYQCIKRHWSNETNEPTSGFDWTTYWMPVGEWTPDQEYHNGDFKKGSNSKVYRCFKDHTSQDINKPVTGADWREYWATMAVCRRCCCPPTPLPPVVCRYCPGPAPEWLADHYYSSYWYGDLVLGTDGVVYRCIVSHTSIDGPSGNRPTTGANWATYWAPIQEWSLAHGTYYYGEYVLGTDGWVYKSAGEYTPLENNRPVTGSNWPTRWWLWAGPKAPLFVKVVITDNESCGCIDFATHPPTPGPSAIANGTCNGTYILPYDVIGSDGSGCYWQGVFHLLLTITNCGISGDCLGPSCVVTEYPYMTFTVRRNARYIYLTVSSAGSGGSEVWFYAVKLHDTGDTDHCVKCSMPNSLNCPGSWFGGGTAEISEIEE